MSGTGTAVGEGTLEVITFAMAEEGAAGFGETSRLMRFSSRGSSSSDPAL